MRRGPTIRIAAWAFSAIVTAALSSGCANLHSGKPTYQENTWRELVKADSRFSPSEGATLKAGVFRTDITPPPGTPLAGFGRRKGKPSTGVRDPLYARALVLDNDESRVAFVSLDMMAVHEEFFEEVLRQIPPDLKIDRHQLFLMASHSHSASGGLTHRWAYERVSGKFDRRIFENTAAQVASVIAEALKHAEPVHVGSGSKLLSDVNQNRMKKGAFADSEMTVVRFDRMNGNPLAFMVNFAVHPTILGSSNFEFSADFVGFLNGTLESTNPGSVCLFINGAAADLKPSTRTHPTDYEEAEEYGKRLGSHAMEIAEGIKTTETRMLSSFSVPVKLPPVRVHYGWWVAPRFLGNRFFDRDTVMGGARVGSLVFLSAPGELSTEIGARVKERVRKEELTPILMGFTNDYSGYMIQREDYKLPEYESTVSFHGKNLGPYVEEILMKEVDMLTHASGVRLERNGDLTIVTLKGTPYELGYQHGVLLEDEVHAQWNHIMSFARKQLPIPLVNRMYISWKLRSAYRAMEPYISNDYKEEMRGLAAGADISLKKVHWAHAIPDLFPTLCAGGVYYGKATRDGKLYHLRNLDWSRGMGVHDRSAVFVVHPNDKHAFVNFGYAGFIGVLTGINKNGLSVGQIGCETVDYTLKGEPMPLLLRRVLEEAENMEDAETMVSSAHRTYGYNYVFADAKEKKASAIETTQQHASVFSAGDSREAESGYGAPLEDALLRSDTAFDPIVRSLQTASGGDPHTPEPEFPSGKAYEVRYKKQAELARASYGSLDDKSLLQIAKEIAPGSNIQSVLFGYPDVWVANAKGDSKAADEEYRHLNVEELLSK